ncbi:hypothetical protein JCM3770_004343 [Rhodotorula araucariae]
MFSYKRRPPPLPVTYKDKHLRPPSLRVRIRHLCTRPTGLLALFLVLFLATAWSLGLVSTATGRTRLGAGPKVVARSWNDGLGVPKALGGALVDDVGVLVPAKEYNETILILCPMRNAIEHIWHFFQLVDSLTYPRHLIHVAILASDSSDGTYTRALELADERQYSRGYRGRRYGRISVFEKDFAADEGAQAEYGGDNVGKERHEYGAQVGRRKLLAKSRTWLLGAAMLPEVDWALWLDVDLVDFEPQLIERLMRYARGELEGDGADVVVPNCIWKTYNEMGAYDRNNWVETPESLELKANLPVADVLIEGYKDHPTHRFNLASLVPSDPARALSPHNRYLAGSPLPLSLLPSFPPTGVTLPPALEGTAVVPRALPLDGVGGCAALVRADVHREGAVFPAWPPVDHQIETEGFAQLVKALRRGSDGEMGRGGRGRMLGLPRYYVYHGLYG